MERGPPRGNLMDVNDIIGMSHRAREIKYQCGPRIYTLRIPTEHEMRVIHQRVMKDDAGPLLFQREVTLLAVVNWSGVTLGDILPDQPPADLPYDRKLVPVLFDAQEMAGNTTELTQLTSAVFAEYNKRSEVLETDKGNS